MFFIDFVDNMEKIGDHLTNIAEGVLAGLQWGFQPGIRRAVGEEAPIIPPNATSSLGTDVQPGAAVGERDGA
jgi:hypothetical protein